MHSPSSTQSSCFARSTWTVKFSLCILIYIDIFCVWIQYWYEYLWYWFFYLYIDIDQWYMYIYFLLFLIYLYDIFMYIYICRYDNLDSLWAFSTWRFTHIDWKWQLSWIKQFLTHMTGNDTLWHSRWPSQIEILAMTLLGYSQNEINKISPKGNYA